MGANPNIFIDKENRRIVPPEEENFFVSAEEFKAIDTAFASKADQTDLDTLDGRVGTLETDLGTAETNIGNLETGKLDASALVTDFVDPDNVTVPSTLAVETKIDEEINLQVPTINTNQVVNNSGVALIKTVFDRPTATVIDFISSGTKGSPILPVYDTFTINEASLIDDNKFNKWIYFFSCNTEPTVTSSPASYVVKTGTILTGYANLNRVELTLDYNVSGILKVFMNITQMAAANLDPAPPTVGDPDILVQLMMQETGAIGTVATNNFALIDSSTYAVSGIVVRNQTGVEAPTAQRIAANQGYNFTTTSRAFIVIDPNSLNGGAIGSLFSITFRCMSMVGANGSVVLFDNNDIALSDGIRIHCSSSNLMWIDLNRPDTAGEIRTTSALSFTTMQNWTFTFDGTNLVTYLNAVQVHTSTLAAGSSITNLARMRVNQSYTQTFGQNAAYEYFDITKRALTGTEVEDLHAFLDDTYNPLP